jgi:hypothetical protein
VETILLPTTAPHHVLLKLLKDTSTEKLKKPPTNFIMTNHCLVTPWLVKQPQYKRVLVNTSLTVTETFVTKLLNIVPEE